MKRRGPPRKRIPEEELPIQTRLACLAGWFGRPEDVAKLASRGYLDALSSGSAARPASIDPAIHILVRPALRPQDVEDVVIDGDWLGVAAEFEV